MPLHRNQSYLRNGLKFGRVKRREDTVSTRVITRSAKSFRSSLRHTGKKGMGTPVLSAMYFSSGARGRAPTSIDAARRVARGKCEETLASCLRVLLLPLVRPRLCLRRCRLSANSLRNVPPAAHRRRVGVHCPPRAVAIIARTPKGRARACSISPWCMAHFSIGLKVRGAIVLYKM